MESRHSPYQGLVPYYEADRDFFFGRDRERQTISFNLRGARLTILYGPTGVGKSSVLRAGVVTDLQELARDNLKIEKSVESIAVVFSSWGDDPIRGLTSRIKDSIEQILPGAGLIEPKQDGLVTTIQSYASQLNCDFLIILDQFEEYFLYQRQPSVTAFGDELVRTINTSGLHANFLISIREDALARLDVFKDRIPRLFDNCLRIEHLHTKAAQDAIRRPIDAYNKKFQPKENYIVEDDLVHAVCRQVVSSRLPGPSLVGASEQPVDWLYEDSQIEAPLLQLVMIRIWDKEQSEGSTTLRLRTLDTLGKAGTIVKDQLESVMTGLLEDEKDLAADIFHYLVTPTGYKVAHTLKDLSGYTGHPPEILEPVVRKLSSNESRILRAVPSTWGTDVDSRYEIFHDVLAPAVLQWVSAFQQERKSQAEKLRLLDEAKHKEQLLEKARKRILLTRIFVLALAILLTLVWFFYRFALKQRDKAVTAEQLAVEQRKKLIEEVNYRNELELTFPYLKLVLRGHNNTVNKALLSPDGTIAATAGDDNTARLWDAHTGAGKFTLKHDAPVVDITFSGSGKWLACAAGDSATLWDVATGHQLATFRISAAKVRKVTFNPNETLLVTSSDDPIVRVWDISTANPKYELRGHNGPITDAQFSPDGTLLVTASVDHTARIWSMETGAFRTELREHLNIVNSAVFTANGNQVVTASDDWTLRLWSVRGGRSLWKMIGHSGPVHSVEAASAGPLVVSASADRTARVWDTEKRQSVVLRGHSDDVTSARFSSDGSMVITASTDRTARIWAAITGKLLQDLRAHIKPVKSAVFGKDSKFGITASVDSTARIWSVGGEGALTVTEAKVSVTPTDYSGPCPAFVKVFGRISVTGVSGDIKYRFVREGSEGNEKPGPEKTLSFDGPGTKEVGAVYQLGGPSFPNIGGAFYLEILEPRFQKSDKVDHHVKCDTSTPAPKSTP